MARNRAIALPEFSARMFHCTSFCAADALEVSVPCILRDMLLQGDLRR
jgi:hypothetical protein